MAQRRRLLGAIALGLTLAGSVWATPPASAVIGTPPQPGWRELSVAQRTILAPLGNEWDSLENYRKKKWLLIIERFPKMSADEQRRVQDRMREWTRMTPEQRAQVRDSYKEFNQLPQDKRQALKEKWEAYSNLPPEEKERVRQGGKLPTKPAANPPSDSPATAAPATAGEAVPAAPPPAKP